MKELWTWLGIVFCISQAAMFSGMNLAVFSLSLLRLRAAASSQHADALRVLALRENPNFALATILWGNVSINVLLTLLADSVLAGLGAFLFSTLAITLLGEILPQAYFSRHALRMASSMAPIIRFYELLLWPLAWPTGKALDAWVGQEGIPWFREQELRDILRQHARDAATEVSHVEATGAINFLSLDDIPVGQEGEALDPRSILRVPMVGDKPNLPPFQRDPNDPFLVQLEASGKKWVVFIDESEEPRFMVNAHAFLREVLFGERSFHPHEHCHLPLIVRDPDRPLGQVLGQLTVQPQRPEDDVVDEDVILVWTADAKRIITGSDLLGRLLRGIVRRAPGTTGDCPPSQNPVPPERR